MSRPADRHEPPPPAEWMMIDRVLSGPVEALDPLPGFFGGLDVRDERHILRVDHAFVGEVAEVDGVLPELPPEEQNGERLHLERLNERQRFEQLVEGSIAAREGHQSFRTK